MRYENLKFEYCEIDDGILSLHIVATDELVDIVNNIREKNGNTDLVEIEYDNEVYYNFYLISYLKDRKISIISVCNNGEKDDCTCYEIPIGEDEKEIILFQLIKELSKSIDNE